MWQDLPIARCSTYRDRRNYQTTDQLLIMPLRNRRLWVITAAGCAAQQSDLTQVGWTTVQILQRHICHIASEIRISLNSVVIFKLAEVTWDSVHAVVMSALRSAESAAAADMKFPVFGTTLAGLDTVFAATRDPEGLMPDQDPTPSSGITEVVAITKQGSGSVNARSPEPPYMRMYQSRQALGYALEIRLLTPLIRNLTQIILPGSTLKGEHFTPAGLVIASAFLEARADVEKIMIKSFAVVIYKLEGFETRSFNRWMVALVSSAAAASEVAIADQPVTVSTSSAGKSTDSTAPQC